MKMKSNMKKTVIGLSSLFLLAACNGGGGGGSGSNNTPTPTPTPSPTPVAMQPLVFSQYYLDKNGVLQSGAFSMNKVGGHQIWYMVVTNPNSFSIVDNAAFTYENSGSPINPTEYSTTYNGEISGVTKQCNSILGHSGELQAGEKCAYKFEAMWDKNTTESTNFSIKMSYSLIDLSKFDNNTYDVYDVKSNCKPTTFINGKTSICLAGIDTEGLSFNLMKLPEVSATARATSDGGVSSANWINSNIGSELSMDGKKSWEIKCISKCGQYDVGSLYTATRYTVTYNSANNQISKTIDQTWTGNWFVGRVGLSADGENAFFSNYNQYGFMTYINQTDSITWPPLDWRYGLDGQLYATGVSYGYYYILNQTPDAALLNETKSRLARVVDYPNDYSFIEGVSKKGDLWTREGRGYYSCLSKENNYAVKDMDMSGLAELIYEHSTTIGSDGYRGKFYKSGYTDLEGQRYSVGSYYLINIDSCQIESNNYYLDSGDHYRGMISKNRNYALYYTINDSTTETEQYVFPLSQISDGTNGN